jgi:aspartyl-tRNA(Asn)/glutamyl-tRNA(Gln) amidotransferase subunit C
MIARISCAVERYERVAICDVVHEYFCKSESVGDEKTPKPCTDCKIIVGNACRWTRVALNGGQVIKESLMSIDTAIAAKVAKLARIRVEEDALPALAEEFNTILGFIEQLNEVDVEGVEPMTSVTPQRLKRRADVVNDGDQQDKVLKNAPDAREGFFAVPKVVE